MTAAPALLRWDALVRFVNGRPGLFAEPGIRDPEHPCEVFDGRGYDGTGRCHSDGHWLCVECSQLSPQAARFEEYGRDGRADRLRYFWARHDLRARADALTAALGGAS